MGESSLPPNTYYQRDRRGSYYSPPIDCCCLEIKTCRFLPTSPPSQKDYIYNLNVKLARFQMSITNYN